MIPHIYRDVNAAERGIPRPSIVLLFPQELFLPCAHPYECPHRSPRRSHKHINRKFYTILTIYCLIVVLLTEQGLTMDNRTESRLKISEVQLMKSECNDKLVKCLKKREEI
jgi:hypothetical protein